MEKGRILALDPGTKRVGVAISDEMRWIAQPLQTFERRSPQADVAHIEELVQRHGVCEVVMGMPLRSDGTMGPEAQCVQQFMKTLEQLLKVPVVPWDERLTSRSAESLLIAADVSRKKRKSAVDRVAAAILLQSYLEAHSDDHETAPTVDDSRSNPIDP